MRILMFILTAFCLALVSISTKAEGQSFIAQYSPAKTRDFDSFNRQLYQNHTLEELAEKLSSQISLPEPVTLTIAECGQANAFYNSQYRAIVICYELVGQMANGIQRSFKGIASPQEINDSISGGLSFILLHELGHALIRILDLPVLGREEDAADQIAAYLILQPPGNSPSSALAGALWFFRSGSSLFYTRRHFSDTHSLGPQRQSNLACWAYGKDPIRYQYLLVGKHLTYERSLGCADEYQKLDSTVHKLLGSNVHLANN